MSFTITVLNNENGEKLVFDYKKIELSYRAEITFPKIMFLGSYSAEAFDTKHQFMTRSLTINAVESNPVYQEGGFDDSVSGG